MSIFDGIIISFLNDNWLVSKQCIRCWPKQEATMDNEELEKQNKQEQKEEKKEQVERDLKTLLVVDTPSKVKLFDINNQVIKYTKSSIII